MICPYCKSNKYHFVQVADYDESDTSLEFKCYECEKTFFGMYSFLYFEDEEGNEM
jgi:transposase-like protein